VLQQLELAVQKEFKYGVSDEQWSNNDPTRP
jgi:hypothetical protein